MGHLLASSVCQGKPYPDIVTVSLYSSSFLHVCGFFVAFENLAVGYAVRLCVNQWGLFGRDMGFFPIPQSLYIFRLMILRALLLGNEMKLSRLSSYLTQAVLKAVQDILRCRRI
jgi:hypothetical protein